MKREFVIHRQGKDYVLYAGLLDQAHQQGLTAIKTQLLQAPAAENGQVAICLAEVTTERGTFTGLGDADPGNVNRMMANALIRMAETRAKARALRDAVNVGMVAIEELAETSADGPADEPLRLGGEVARGSGETSRAAGDLPRSVAELPRGGGDIVAFPGARGASGAPPAVPPAQPAAAAAAAMPAPAGAEEAAGAGPASTGPAFGGRPAAARQSAQGGQGAARQGDVAPLPPTQTQLETIAKLARSTGRTVPTEGLTRAAASELITRLSEERYGARRSP